MKSFVTSQFSYCPLINAIHERALRITYKDSSSTFQELLNKDKSVTIHHRNLQVLATEMFKVKNQMAPDILDDIFINRKQSYNLRNNSSFSIRRVHSVYHGTESLSFLGPKIWELVPDDLKESESFEIFKRKIKGWIPTKCPCRLCRVYIQNVGFI